ncbi:MAG TPA: methyltransferase domain-containing protein [Chthoniobacterales bacterium]
MSAETLTCAAGSMDAVVSRFGLLMFGDVAASGRELARVLRSGGRFSVAVWHDMNKNTLVKTVIAALRPHCCG